MAKSASKTKAAAFKVALLSTLPWNHTSFGDGSEIEACVAGTDKWETIANVHSFASFDGEEIASYIICAVNGHEGLLAQLQKARIALELCLQCKDLTPKIKQKAEEAINALTKTGDALAE